MTLIVAILTLLSMPPQVKQRLPDRASISGSVVRADTNAPISRPTILLTRVGGQLSDSITVLGNTDGRFTVRNIQPGTYRVFAGHPDYVRSEFAQRGLNRPGSPIELVVGQDHHWSRPRRIQQSDFKSVRARIEIELQAG